jgi:hypothetical protein
MRKESWFRFGLASVLLGAGVIGVTVAGCSDDDPVTPGTDAGTDARTDGTTPPPPPPPPPDAGDGGTATPAKILLVHAAPGAPAVRVCFASGQADDGADLSVSPLPPLPAAAQGLPPGAGGALPRLPVNPAAIAITGFLVRANLPALTPDGGPPPACAQLLGPKGEGTANAVLGTDFWKLPTIPKGRFEAEKTFAVVVTGCAAGATFDNAGNVTQNSPKCSPNDQTPGTLGARIVELDRTPAAADKVGVQVYHASSPVERAVAPDGVNVALVPIPGDAGTPDAGDTDAGDDGGDAGTTDAGATPGIVLATGLKFGVLAPAGGQALATADTATLYRHNLVVSVPSGPTIPLPIGLVERFTTGAAQPSGNYFEAGKNYTFFLLGDPTATAGDPPGGVGDRYKFHVIGLPNDPVIQALGQ